MTGDDVLDEIDVRGFWGPRHEGLDQCTARLHDFLTRIGGRDRSLARWFRTGDTRAEALSKPVEVEPSGLRGWLRDDGPKYDDDGQRMEDLGFGVSAWNGEGNGTAKFRERPVPPRLTPRLQVGDDGHVR